MAISDYYVGVIDYFATGEGVTVAVAIGPSPRSVEKQLRSFFDDVPGCADYFMVGAEIMPYTHPDVPKKGHMPPAIEYMMERTPYLEYKHHYHFNLS